MLKECLRSFYGVSYLFFKILKMSSEIQFLDYTDLEIKKSSANQTDVIDEPLDELEQNTSVDC